jgi:hypothetical protein
MSAIVYAPIRYSRLRAAATEAMLAARPPLWLCAAQAIVAYEWLVSGANKFLNPWFSAHVPAMLPQGMQGSSWYMTFQQGMQGNGWDVTVLRDVVMPRSAQAGAVVTWSQTAIGVVLLLSALLWATWPEHRLTPRLARAACLALAAAVAMKVADYLMSGNGLPWTDPTHAYAAGVLLDAVLSLIALALLGANVRSLRKLSQLYQ